MGMMLQKIRSISQVTFSVTGTVTVAGVDKAETVSLM